MNSSDWETVNLSEYCSKIGSGATPRGGDTVYKDQGVSLIRSQNVYNGYFTNDGLAHIGEDHAKELQNVTVEPDDILLNITGDSVARSCQVPLDVLPARVNQHVAIIRTISKELDPGFLSYYLISPYMQSFMLSLAGSGGTRNALTKVMIENFKVPKPPLDVQNKVARYLRSYDDMVENSRRRIIILEESARQLYQEWFVRLRFPGHEHTKIVDGVPNGWVTKALGDICDDIRDCALPEQLEPTTPYIGLEHLPRRSITLSEWGSAEAVTSMKHRFREGEIIFGKIRPYFHKVGVALVNGVASSDAIIIRPHTEELRSLTLMTVSSDQFVAATSQTMKEGSKMPRADWKLMKTTSVLIPPSSILKPYNDFIDTIVQQLRILALQSRKLRQARDLLLPRLMSGEVTV